MAMSESRAAEIKPSAASLPRARDASLDISRGIAMSLVVLSHSFRGLFVAGIVDSDSALTHWADRALYLGHLPVFAVVTGMLMPRSVEAWGPRKYLQPRLMTFLYIYVVWTFIQGGIEVATSRWKNTPTSWSEVLSLWVPIAQMWFMPMLIMATIAVAIIRPWRHYFHHLPLVLGVVLSAAVWGWYGNYAFTQGIGLVAFFLVGAYIGHEQALAFLRSLRTRTLLLGSTLTALAWIGLAYWPHITVVTLHDPDRTVFTILSGITASIFGVICLISVSTVLARVAIHPGWWTKPAEVMAIIGRYSLQVYVAHIVFAAGVRIGLVRLGFTDPRGHLLLGTVIAIAGALAVERITRPWPWLFTPPWLAKRT